MKSFLIKLSVMLFVLLSVSISFGTVVFAKNVMVIAPHEDDETLMAAGVIKDAVTKGDTVKVVLVTNGDFQGLGLTRIQESVNALNYLGVSTGNACFLGYGDTGSSYNDSFVMKLYNATNPTQIYSSLQGTQTYGNPGIGVNDYHYTKYGVHGDYNRATLLGDLQSVISENMPDDIYTTALNDGHGDHSAVFMFTNEALINIKKSSPSYSPVVHSTIIHAQGGADDTTWPLRESDPAPLATFTQPGTLSSYSVQSWENRESIAVPAVMNTIPRATNIKHTAISMYNSQVAEAPDYLYAFTNSNEYFWRKDYSNIALLSTVSVSSEDTTNNQQGVKAIDGITDGYPRFAPREWVTVGQGAGAWIQLNWSEAYAINRIVLYDRPNTTDQIVSGTLSFSDGTTVSVGALNNNGSGNVITFPTKYVTWVKFTVNSTIGNNTGLSEFEVYGNPATAAVVGNMDNGNSYDSCGTDLTLCRYYAGQSIVANLVKANIVASPGKVKCAIYGDNAGTPGAMLMDTNELTAPKAGWTTFNLVSPITLNSGTYYWIAIWSNGDLKVAADLTGSGLYTGSYTYGIWPNSPTDTTTNGFTHCLYAEGTLSSGTKYEAENGTKSGTCYSDTNGFGYSGAGYLAGIDLAVGNSVSMTVNVTTGGSHNIDFRYSNGTGTSKTLSIYVNGTHVENLLFPATGDWDTTWATVNSSFTLNAGNNTIKIQYDSGDGPVDIDYIRVY